MPWEETQTSDERLKFIAQVLSGDSTMTDLYRRFGVSRKTGYKWTKQYEAGGPAARVELSQRPHSHSDAIPVARVAFQFPKTTTPAKWHQQMIEQQLAAKKAKSDSDSPAMLAVDKLNFGYRISGSNEHLRPLRVYDDGAKTYIQMPPEIEHRQVPVLLVMDADGKGEMTNYRVRQQTFIVDRLFDRAQLVLGAGKEVAEGGD